MIVRLKINENCMKRLAAVQPRIIPALRQGIGKSLNLVEKEMKQSVSSKLKTRTGRLLKAVRASRVFTRGNRVYGGLPDNPREKGSGWYYGWFHEKGVTIVPKKAKYLRIPVGDGTIRFVKKVVLRPRKWFIPAIKATLPRVRNIMHKRLESCFR